MKDTRIQDTRYISLLHVVACIAVVVLHTNGCFWNFSSTKLYWKTANVIESVFYFAVPIFFMVSGATLIDYMDRYSTKQFFVKRIQKTVIPFIVWSLFGIVFGCFVLKKIPVEDIGLVYIYNSVLNTSAVSVFWFFPPLFCAYLCMPLFAAVDKSRRLQVFTYVAVAGYILNVFIPFFRNLFFSHLSFPFSLAIAGSPLVYLVIGYLLSHYDCPAAWKKTIYISAVVALIVHIVGTYYLSMEADSVVKTFKNLIVAVPYASGIFCFFRTYGNRIMDSFVGKIVDFLKRYTFAIYLLHWFVMKSLLLLYPFNTRQLIYQLGAPIMIIPICIAITFILRKIPILKHIVP